MSIRYRAMMLMALLAVIFMGLHVWSGWEAFVDEASWHSEKALWSQYMMVWFRDTVENLQSEFWQLAVQFALIAGVLKAIGIQAYEEDVEETKQMIRQLEAKIDKLNSQS